MLRVAKDPYLPASVRELRVLSTDSETCAALRQIETIAIGKQRPLLIWVGAGASRWAGYPSWPDLAAKLHSLFSREEPAYDKVRASLALADCDYPALFELTKAANSPRYREQLAVTLGPRPGAPIYERFLRALRSITPHRVVTTNVDEGLERNLSTSVLVQRSDIERVPDLLHQGQSFICKLHGSVSAVETATFCTSDYSELVSNTKFVDVLAHLLSDCHVLFLGYGVRDQYVLDAISRAQSDRPLFGSGPHFIVTSDDASTLPSNVRRVRYVPDFADHRDALLCLEIVAQAQRPPQPNATESVVKATTARESIYFLADLITPGKWTTSQTMEIIAPDKSSKQMIVGPGYADGEVVIKGYSAFHDVLVGLICFDCIAIGLGHLARVHELLGAEFFWRLVSSNAIRVVNPPSQPAVTFVDPQALIGDLGSIQLGAKASTFDSFSPIGLKEGIRRQLSPIPGKEQDAERLFEMLESRTLDLSSGGPENLADQTRSVLAHPAVRRLLGVSGGTPLSSVPRWLVFPTLRLAGVVTTASICERIGASATRLLWGTEGLATAAFSTAFGESWADEAASYVMTGRYDSDVGQLVASDPALLVKIIEFRESSVGSSFRQEVMQRLQTNEAGHLAASVNAGLRQALPATTLQAARDKLSGLYEPGGTMLGLAPAIWSDLRNSEERIAGWRKRSRQILEGECKRLGIGLYDQCPCGSGEKLKFCCHAALQ